MWNVNKITYSAGDDLLRNSHDICKEFAKNLQGIQAIDFTVYNFVDKSHWKVRVSKKQLVWESEMTMKQKQHI